MQIALQWIDRSQWAQVGDPGADHATWGRAEDMTMARPAYDVDEKKPGSDQAQALL